MPDNMDLIVNQIQKEYGKGSIFKMDEETVEEDYDSIPTGSIGLDNILSTHGLVKGALVEVYGREASGKTTLLLHIIKNALKDSPDKGVAFLDVEHALDGKYAKKILGNFNRVFIAQPGNAEEGLDIMERLIRSGEFSAVVLDSIAGLTSKNELEGKITDKHVAEIARLMSRSCRILPKIIVETQTLAVFSNQIRDTIGYGGKVTPGGYALKFRANVRIELRRGEFIGSQDKYEGIWSKIKVQKNKYGPPFRSSKMPIIFGEGISREQDILDFAGQFGLIKKSGSWFSYEGTQLGQGRTKVREFFFNNPEVMDELEEKILTSLSVI